MLLPDSVSLWGCSQWGDSEASEPKFWQFCCEDVLYVQKLLSAIELPISGYLSISLLDYVMIVVYCERAERASKIFDTICFMKIWRNYVFAYKNNPKWGHLTILPPDYKVVIMYCERAKRASKKFDTFSWWKCAEIIHSTVGTDVGTESCAWPDPTLSIIKKKNSYNFLQSKCTEIMHSTVRYRRR